MQSGLEAPIPQEKFAETARILAWVYALRDLRKGAPA